MIDVAKPVKRISLTCSRKDATLRRVIPDAITLLRLLILPHLAWSFINQLTSVTYALFLFALGTDLADGYIARKIGKASAFGSNLDVTIDFLFISGMFFTFTLRNLYPFWILLPILLVFVQFMLTNHQSKRTIYDPIGKFYGSILFGGVGLTLLFDTPAMYFTVTVGVVTFTAATLLSRLLFLKRQDVA
jgi:phosphatidylglycerophosphate synthase